MVPGQSRRDAARLQRAVSFAPRLRTTLAEMFLHAFSAGHGIIQRLFLIDDRQMLLSRQHNTAATDRPSTFHTAFTMRFYGMAYFISFTAI